MTLQIIPMVISPDNQLVPYKQAPGQLTPYTPQNANDDPADHQHMDRPYPPMPDPLPPEPGTYPENQGYFYTSKSQLKAQEINRLGLLINIYA